MHQKVVIMTKFIESNFLVKVLRNFFADIENLSAHTNKVSRGICVQNIAITIVVI